MKSYVTPMLSFESFALTSNTATSCGEHIDTHSAGTCGIDKGGGQILFLTNMDVCNDKVEEGDIYCYHVPTLGNNLFNS